MKIKILLVFFLLALALGFYIVSGSKIVKVKQVDNGKPDGYVDVAKMDKEYKEKMEKIVGEYDALILDLRPLVESATSTKIFLVDKDKYLTKVLDLKERMLALRLSRKNNSHMVFFQSIIKMDNFLNSGEISDWRESLEMLDKVKIQNDLFWF